MKKVIRNIFLIIIAVPVLALLYVFIYTSLYSPKVPGGVDMEKLYSAQYSSYGADTLRTFGKNWARKVNENLYVCYTEGSPEERGYAYGSLLKDLMIYQERALFERMEETIESEFYRKFLCRFARFYNSGIVESLTEEQRREIYGLSLADTDDFNYLAEPYERQLNLHAAHDIGHAMQDYMLVGCSSFVLNDGRTKDSTLIFGRNFDFYCGEDFAKTKVIAVTKPDSGYAFVSVTWGGMLGVVSGMNEKGLAICINASKLDVPKSVAMPISMLVRHILIHCRNIDEAYAEAQKYKTFVSENIVIASKEDNGMAIIEKSPEDITLYKSSDKDVLLCTNHFQSDKFMKDERNLRNYNETDTKYRFELLGEYISKKEKFSVEDAMNVLLNPYGKEGKNIGYGNEKTINQLIAHHSVVFNPDSLVFYLSSEPKNFTPYLKFSLDSLLNGFETASEVSVGDSIYNKELHTAFLKYEEQRRTIRKQATSDTYLNECNIFTSRNPNFFEAYDLAGDYCLRNKDKTNAVSFWKQALDCEIPKLAQKKSIEEKIKKYE